MNRTLKAAIVGAALLALPAAILAQPPNAPFAAQAKMTCAQALVAAPKEDPGLAPLAKTFDAAAAKLKKSPKDAKAKKAYVESGAKYEQTIVNGAVKLSPPMKYRAGLALCRMVLAVDPKNAPYWKLSTPED